MAGLLQVGRLTAAGGHEQGCRPATVTDDKPAWQAGGVRWSRRQVLTPEEQLASAIQLLHDIVPTSGQEILIDPDTRPSIKMVYTNGVTRWMLMVAKEMQSGDRSGSGRPNKRLGVIAEAILDRGAVTEITRWSSAAKTTGKTCSIRASRRDARKEPTLGS